MKKPARFIPKPRLGWAVYDPPPSSRIKDFGTLYAGVEATAMPGDRIVRVRIMPMVGAERLAQRFHEAYERLAPAFGYATRRASAVPWANVPAKNRALMIAAVREVFGTPKKEDARG